MVSARECGEVLGQPQPGSGCAKSCACQIFRLNPDSKIWQIMCHLLLSLASFTSPPSLGKSCLLTALAGLGGNLDPGKLSKEAARRDAGNWSKDRVTAPPRTTPCLLRLLPSLLERPWPSSSCFNFASASLFERFIKKGSLVTQQIFVLIGTCTRSRKHPRQGYLRQQGPSSILEISSADRSDLTHP